MAKFLDDNGLIYLWSKIKALIPKRTSELTNDSGFITSSDIPEGAAASTTTPLMNGTAAVGTEMAFARGDHIHPSDTSKVDKVSGKGLSTNDYTTAEKQKLAGIGDGTTSAKGLVQLTDSYTSDSTTTAATPKAVKSAYDLANSKQSPATSLSGYGIADAYTKSEVDAKLTSAVKYKGTVATYSALPTSNSVGDMYNVTTADTSVGLKAGDNVVWNGTAWDIQSGAVDLSGCVQNADAITNAEIDTILAS